MSILVYFSAKGNPITDSLRVAKAFGKKHKNVLQAIGRLEYDAEFSRLNFGSSTYTDGRGKQQPAVLMTRAGFTFLVMGFTGKKAADFKQGYIAQFDQIEAQLRTPQAPAVPLPDFTRPEVQVQQVKDTARRLFRLNHDPRDIMQHHRGVMKYLTARGHTLEQLAATGIPETLSAAFAAILRCGITPAELPAA